MTFCLSSQAASVKRTATHTELPEVLNETLSRKDTAKQKKRIRVVTREGKTIKGAFERCSDTELTIRKTTWKSAAIQDEQIPLKQIARVKVEHSRKGPKTVLIGFGALPVTAILLMSEPLVYATMWYWPVAIGLEIYWDRHRPYHEIELQQP